MLHLPRCSLPVIPLKWQRGLLSDSGLPRKVVIYSCSVPKKPYDLVKEMAKSMSKLPHTNDLCDLRDS